MSSAPTGAVRAVGRCIARLLLALMLLPALPARAQDWGQQLEDAARQGPQALEQAVAEAGKQTGFPITGNGQATFVCLSADAREVALASDLSGWDPARAGRFDRVEQTALWLLELPLPDDARLEYRLVVDGEWLTDPLNRDSVDNGLGGRNSVLSMPGYRPAPEAAGEMQGRIETHEVASQILPGTRRVSVYLPPGYPKTGDYPVLWVLDGSQYLEKTRLPVIVENLVAAGALRPCLLALVDPLEREREYSPNPVTARVLVEELVPWMLGRYQVSVRREEHFLLGASLGGLMATYLAWQYWDVWGGALVQSGAFQWQDELIRRWMEPRPAPVTMLRLSVGRWEETLWHANQRLADMLRAKRLPFLQQVHPAGHNWTAWRDALPGLLRDLWPAGDAASLVGPPHPSYGPQALEEGAH